MHPAESKPVHILVVDDRPDGLLAIQAVLSAGTYQLVLASSGYEALACLSQHEFAVILLDVQMPGMDGFTTAQKIKENERWRHIPIIFLTAINKEIAHIYRGYECGAVDYLFKPFDPWVLKSKVEVFVDLFIKGEQIKQQSRLLQESERRERQRSVELSLANDALQMEIAERIRAQREVLEIRDQEQQRIGRDLHDGLAQQLAGIAFISKVLEQKLEHASRTEAGQAAEVMDLVRKAIYETKRLARGFYPVELEKHGLFPALEELALNTAKQFGVECECAFGEQTEIQDKNLATHLYRITQEAVHNAIKHAKARRIVIASERFNGSLLFSISDDGVGFQIQEQEGMGIRTMNYRARMIGAAFSIERGERGGTRVVCRVENEAVNVCKAC